MPGRRVSIIECSLQYLLPPIPICFDQQLPLSSTSELLSKFMASLREVGMFELDPSSCSPPRLVRPQIVASRVPQMGLA